MDVFGTFYAFFKRNIVNNQLEDSRKFTGNNYVLKGGVECIRLVALTFHFFVKNMGDFNFLLDHFVNKVFELGSFAGIQNKAKSILVIESIFVNLNDSLF